MLVGIAIGTFLAGLGIGYGIFQSQSVTVTNAK